MKRLSLVLCVATLALCGCRQDMATQPRYNPLRASSFWSDGRSARPLVEGTVARGHLRADEKYYNGTDHGKLVTSAPFPITRDDLERGRERFNINCAPCHDRLGYGNGMVPQRGFRHPPSYHIDRLRDAPLGHFYDVMTRGFGAMQGVTERVTPEDRWRIAAYIRALQLSQQAKYADIPPQYRLQIDEQLKAASDRAANSEKKPAEKSEEGPK